MRYAVVDIAVVDIAEVDIAAASWDWMGLAGFAQVARLQSK